MSGSLKVMPDRSCGYIGLTWMPGFRIGFFIVLPIPIRTRIFNITDETYFFNKIKTFRRFLHKNGVLDGGRGEWGEFLWIFGRQGS